MLISKECPLIVFCPSVTNQAAAADSQTCGRQQVDYLEQLVQRRPASVLIMAARRPQGEKITQGRRQQGQRRRRPGCEADKHGDEIRQVGSKGRRHVSIVQGASGPLAMLM